MPLRRYAYFALFSQHTSADDITSQLDITPDQVAVRGSRFTEPTVVPVDHSWMVVCREPGLRVDEQITRILDRLQPRTDHICDLTRHLARTGGGAVLQIVRYFNDADQAHPGAVDAPNLFGWHLDRKVLDHRPRLAWPQRRCRRRLPPSLRGRACRKSRTCAAAPLPQSSGAARPAATTDGRTSTRHSSASPPA